MAIIDRCQKVGAKVLLGVMPPIVPEPYFTRHPKETYDSVGGFETYINKYRDTARAVGKEKNVPVIDLNALLQKYPNWVSNDGVHPTEEGNKIMATLVAEKVRPLLNLPAEKK
jgi:lysophospholipase L1-like esterase